MKEKVENLIKKIDNLIDSLEQTKNSSVNFFKEIIPIIKNCQSEGELKKVLDDHLIHASRITDYGAFNMKQCDLFSEMWETANSIYEEI
jgi:hypothetical protein